jgi:surface antigen
VRWKTIALAVGGLAILLSFPVQAAVRHGPASHRSASHGVASHGGGNCVAYAREVTGIELDGNAGLWWSHAAGRYDRGQEPKIGSILVFKSSGHMRSGHVAVVSGIVGPREILLDHANWVRGRITKAMAAIDTSPHNDWTAVKVLGIRPDAGGQRDNPTFGFIYPRNPPSSIAEANTDTPDTRHARVRTAHDHAKPRSEHLQVADATPVAATAVDDVKPVRKHRAEPH